MRVMVSADNLKKPLSTRLVPVSEQNPSLILGEIGYVLQSEEELSLDNSFTIDVVALKAPVGSGRFGKVLNYSKHTKIKKSIITIKNKDQLCCARAIVTGKALADKHVKYSKLRDGRKIQKQHALALHKKANIQPGPCGLEEIARFQSVLPDYQIVVISFPANNATFFEGKSKEKKIVLYYNSGHYDLINSSKLPAFFGKRAFCDKCKKYYNNYVTHSCLDTCKVCQRKSCVKSDNIVQCNDCHRFCRSQQCYDNHKKDHTKNGKKFRSKCSQKFRCMNCNVIVDAQRKTSHACGEHLCHICKEFVPSDHLCYMQNEPVKPPSEQLIFFDVETDQSSSEHVVNYVVSQDFHGNCKVFEGYEALDKFCEYLFDETHRGFSVVSHYGSKFDTLFVLRWLLEHRPTSDIQIIRNGQQIIQLRVNALDIRLIDSFLWFSLPLDKLAKTFDLDTSKFSKGTFPHLFNTRENWNYQGPIPDIKYYSPDNLNA